jgi:hypothetical protein
MSSSQFSPTSRRGCALAFMHIVCHDEKSMSYSGFHRPSAETSCPLPVISSMRCKPLQHRHFLRFSDLWDGDEIENYRTALYLRTSSFFTLRNISW